VSKRTNVLFAKGCEVEGDSNYNLAQALKLARRADAVVLVVGERADMSGEAASRSNLDLPGKQKEFVKAIIGTGKPVVLVLMNGRPLTLSWEAEHATAIIEAWFLGTEAGNAIADVLFGDVNPSGKLTATFPRTVGQIPIYYNYKNTGRPIQEKDKFTSKYLDVPNTPLFPFGYGLSYTTFAYSNLRLSSAAVSTGEDVTVSVDVANTGTRSGDEVVQLYLRDEVGSVTRPVKELKGFQRVSLNAGETKTVEFVLKPEHRSFWNVNMKCSEEPGWFTVLVGGNSETTYHTRFEVK
jgi:beta-glucosidase